MIRCILRHVVDMALDDNNIFFVGSSLTFILSARESPRLGLFFLTFCVAFSSICPQIARKMWKLRILKKSYKKYSSHFAINAL